MTSQFPIPIPLSPGIKICFFPGFTGIVGLLLGWVLVSSVCYLDGNVAHSIVRTDGDFEFVFGGFG